jgi:hypothetical protein
MLTLLFTLLIHTSHAHAWDDVLKQAGLTKETTHFDPLDEQQGAGAEFQTPFYISLHGDPLRVPFFARLYREAMLTYTHKPFEATTSALTRTGLAVRRTLDGDPLKDIEKKTSLVEAIAKVHQMGGKPLTAAEKQKVTKLSKSLSDPAPIAYLLQAEMEALEWRQKALTGLDKKFLAQAWKELMQAPKLGVDDDTSGTSATLRRLIRDVDRHQLMAGGLDLIYAVNKVKDKLKFKPTDRFEWNTPLGAIVIHGDDRGDSYADKPYLLIVDAGGDDTYYGGGGSYDINHPISVLIDLKGNDRYIAASYPHDKERTSADVHPHFGAGVMGYGILYDRAGDDTYAAYRQAMGRGDFGIGVLWDEQGDDHYNCWVQCEGSAEFGAGVLLDSQGADHYDAFQQAQGFGGVQGAGLLLDGGPEDDVYAANTTQIDFPSQVDSKFNVSFVQGAALGVRGDGSDGYSLAGGFGALVDEGGNNLFHAGFFAQGIAYWYGVGWLSVGGGNDQYDAGKYAMGAATHFGVGILHDTGGNDHYKVEQELGLGEGHDFGVGFFLDDSGNDSYEASSLSMGCASAQGMGFFWDRSGDDTYSSIEKEILGCAAIRIDTPSLRIGSRTLGVFLDTGGKNNFKTTIKGLMGTRTSTNWRTPGDPNQAKLTPKYTARLIGVGRVTDAPETEDPL